jgi:hypothetical protein
MLVDVILSGIQSQGDINRRYLLVDVMDGADDDEYCMKGRREII